MLLPLFSPTPNDSAALITIKVVVIIQCDKLVKLPIRSFKFGNLSRIRRIYPLLVDLANAKISTMNDAMKIVRVLECESRLKGAPESQRELRQTRGTLGRPKQA